MDKLALPIAGMALFLAAYAAFKEDKVSTGTAKYQPESLTIAEEVKIIDSVVLDLTEAVEELRVEIAHVHELNVELGDNLNQRIDDMGTTIGTLKTTVSNNAAEAKAYADKKSKETYNKVMQWWEGIDLQSYLPDVSEWNPFKK